MQKYTYTATLSETEFYRLMEIANKKGMKLGEFIHQAILDLIEDEPGDVDFSQDPSFGLWKDDLRTDEEFLCAIGSPNRS